MARVRSEPLRGKLKFELDGQGANVQRVASSYLTVGRGLLLQPRTAASITAMSIFICFIMAAIALAETFLSAFVVNSVSRFG